MPKAYSYSFTQVNCIIGGVPLTGFQNGDGIVLAPRSEQTSAETGCDGEGQRSVMVQDWWDIQINLMQTSAGNDQLQAYWAADQLSLTGSFELLVTEVNGASSFFFRNAHITQVPTTTYAKAAGSRQWSILGLPDEIIIGSNS